MQRAEEGEGTHGLVWVLGWEIFGGEDRGDEATVMSGFGDVRALGEGVVVRSAKEGGQTEVGVYGDLLLSLAMWWWSVLFGSGCGWPS